MLGGDPPTALSNNLANHLDADAVLEGHLFPVRWKLLIITSLVAALINTGGMRALAYWMIDATACVPTPGPAAIFAVLAVPVLFNTLACIFVYRHTARRRKLQVALTALFALFLTGALLLITAKFLPRPPVEARSLPSGAPRGLA